MRNWVQFNPDSDEASLPLNDEIAVYATQAAKHRLDGDFVSKWLPNQAAEIAEVARGLGTVSYTHLTLPTTPYV